MISKITQDAENWRWLTHELARMARSFSREIRHLTGLALLGAACVLGGSWLLFSGLGRPRAPTVELAAAHSGDRLTITAERDEMAAARGSFQVGLWNAREFDGETPGPSRTDDRDIARDAAVVFAGLALDARDGRERDDLAAFVRWTRAAGDADPPYGFLGPCPGDVDGDASTSTDDLIAYFDAFNRGDPIADHDLDGEVTSADIATFLSDYGVACANTISLSGNTEKTIEPKTR